MKPNKIKQTAAITNKGVTQGGSSILIPIHKKLPLLTTTAVNQNPGS